MSRARDPEFLERLLAASARVFARKGLRASRMGDIASEMGVAHGTLYNYVESKEALFYLLVEQGGNTGPIELPAELPLKAPVPDVLLRRIKRAIAASFQLAELDAALRRRRVSDPAAELERVLREFHDRTEATRVPAAVLERSALDLPELFQVYFRGIRRDVFSRFAGYVRLRTEAGYFAPGADPLVAARVLIETVTFFARHRHSDPDPQPLDEAAVRDTVIGMLVRSLVRRARARPTQRNTP